MDDTTTNGPRRLSDEWLEAYLLGYHAALDRWARSLGLDALEHRRRFQAPPADPYPGSHGRPRLDPRPRGG